MKDKAKIIEKWYKELGFPKEYDEQFYALLNNEKNIPTDTLEEHEFGNSPETAGQNLIAYLYFAEALNEKYEEKGISYDVLKDTLSDLIICTDRVYENTKKIGVTGVSWMKLHFSFKLFRLGRLQFCMDGASMDIPEKGIYKGDPVIDVHIPRGNPLIIEDCFESFEMAGKFFAKYFPDYEYKWLTCHSWMLDETIRPFLKPDSNILKFQTLFEAVRPVEMDSILHFVLKYGITREELPNYEAKSGFAKKVKEYALSGGKFYNTLGVRPR